MSFISINLNVSALEFLRIKNVLTKYFQNQMLSSIYLINPNRMLTIPHKYSFYVLQQKVNEVKQYFCAQRSILVDIILVDNENL